MKKPSLPEKKFRPRLNDPHEPALYDDADVAAIRALSAGVASSGQQQKALEWVMFKAAGLSDLSYRAGNDDGRATAFAEGKRFVGLQIAKLLIQPVHLVRK